MRTITILNPGRLVFGNGCVAQFVTDLQTRGLRRLFLITDRFVLPHLTEITRQMEGAGIVLEMDLSIDQEPTVEMVQAVLARAEAFRPDGVAGIGGGSVLDVAKLVAALYQNAQSLPEVFGIGRLSGRGTYLACLPTTAGTGSEVSPNAIIYDPAERLKKGVISPYLVPDGAYVDPRLTLTVPPAVTAATGMDALTHCIEAFTNKFAHPIIDQFALKGVELIAAHLARAVEDGQDLAAREKLALGSLYGGICLGPVNTAAVHALSYPLGSKFKIAHGISNAVLLPYVCEFNLPAAPQRYAAVALALGASPGGDDLATARKGVEKIRELSRACGIPEKISDFQIPETAIDELAREALTVTRLLNNNPRPVTLEDARAIFQAAF